MSEIMCLRTQILDNVQILHPHFKRDHPIGLACSSNDGDARPWRITLFVARNVAVHNDRDEIYAGTGETPEDAYRDMLRDTAKALFGRGY